MGICAHVCIYNLHYNVIWDDGNSWSINGWSSIQVFRPLACMSVLWDRKKYVSVFEISFANMIMRTKARLVLSQYHQCLEATNYEQQCHSGPFSSLFTLNIVPKSYLRKSYLFPLCFILKEAQPLKTPVEFNAEALYSNFLVAIRWAFFMIFSPRRKENFSLRTTG